MFAEPDMPQAWELWVRATGLHRFVLDHPWMWPTMETLHYLGLSTLTGTVGLFDLRVLGLAKAIPPAALHRLIPLGLAGFAVNLMTGVAFFAAFPEQYFYNLSFWWKGTFMALAAVNAGAFYLSPVFRAVTAMPAGRTAPAGARLICAISLTSWVGVLICGRLLTFFRPPFFH